MIEPSVSQLVALRDAGKRERALSCGKYLAVLKPSGVDALHVLGVLLCESDARNDGLTHLARAARITPDNSQIWLNLARAHRRLGQYLSALESIKKALLLAPHDPTILQLACGCAMSRELSSSVRRFARLISGWSCLLEPMSPDGACNKAVLMRREGSLEAALHFASRAMALSPDLIQGLSCRADVLAEIGGTEQACRLYEWAWKVDPASHDLPYRLSQLQLGAGQYQSGWCNYEHRWTASIGVAQSRAASAVRASRPTYDASRSGQRVLVWAEQGIGDEIMFGGLLEEFRPRCEKLLVQLDPRLVGIFSRAMPHIEFFGYDQPLPADRYDEQLPIGSLGAILRPTPQAFFGRGGAYLFPRDRMVKDLRAGFAVGNNELLVGLSWRSGNPDSAQTRSIPLETLLVNLRHERVRFLNLQYGRVNSELDAASKTTEGRMIVHPGIDLTCDIDGVADLIACCDLVISVGNSMAHLTGALGRRAWVLLPQVAAWRWMDQGDSCPWYSSLRLFRQSRRDDWTGVLSAVREAMRTELSQ